MEIKSRPGPPGNRCFGREKRNIVLQKKLLMSDLIVLCMRERDFAGFCMDVSFKHFLYSQIKDSYCS